MKVVSYLYEKFESLGGTPLEYKVYRELVKIEISNCIKELKSKK